MQPPAIACPFTAATTGFAKSKSVAHIRLSAGRNVRT